MARCNRDSFLQVGAYHHADKFARKLTMVVVEAVQIGDQSDVGWLEAREVHWRLRHRAAGAAEAQPFGRHTQPRRHRAQLFLGRDRFSNQPFAGGMNGDRAAVETQIELSGQFGRTVWRLMRACQRLLQTRTEQTALIR